MRIDNLKRVYVPIAPTHVIARQTPPTRPINSKCASRVEKWRGGTSVLRFHFPLIEPDVRISRIRLSDWSVHAEAHE
jgi:hypothetical protein